MPKSTFKRYLKEFGKKEKVLNYTCQTYQLSRPNKVGTVMALIRECQPKSFEEWQKWYFQNANTDGKTPSKITKESLEELGERLYVKIKEIVIPEWTEAFNQLTLQDCVDYIFNLTINRTYDGFIREKSVIEDNLAKEFPNVKFVESDPELDHAGDIDYLGWVGKKAFGIQI
ncbi:MAG: restriction endonuclease, partial [Bacteroidetes bacterium RIFCSPLOWO2_02_FULL_36_8]